MHISFLLMTLLGLYFHQRSDFLKINKYDPTESRAFQVNIHITHEISTKACVAECRVRRASRA
jgi:hypothetical protein